MTVSAPPPAVAGTIQPMYLLFEEAGKFMAGRVLSETDTSAQVELESGKRVKVKLDLTYTNGKSKSVKIDAEDIATFVVSSSVRSVSFSQISTGTSGAALITSKSGYGYIPLNPGSVLTKSSIPASNIRVLNP